MCRALFFYSQNNRDQHQSQDRECLLDPNSLENLLFAGQTHHHQLDETVKALLVYQVEDLGQTGHSKQFEPRRLLVLEHVKGEGRRHIRNKSVREAITLGNQQVGSLVHIGLTSSNLFSSGQAHEIKYDVDCVANKHDVL